VDLLLKAGANIKAVDKQGNTALMISTLNNDTDIIMLLLKRGASNDVKDQIKVTSKSHGPLPTIKTSDLGAIHPDSRLLRPVWSYLLPHPHRQDGAPAYPGR
jgi:ankyrin repeat protein